jgi:hypothetical protein
LAAVSVPVQSEETPELMRCFPLNLLLLAMSILKMRRISSVAL